ncbi:hypothetical protein [Pedobacter sp. ASV28]|uniref:hypothetical protein n=1 Tax=Pedobacter sp. ASV28 TaxID=2795123 RepID=UPI0018EE2B71|nr:hypothetical protein [Pedobacter sp. ASV28]
MLVICISCSYHAIAQTGSPDAAAQALTQRMRDTLQLRNGQRDSIYAINVHLNELSSAVRAQGQPDSLQPRLQRIEYTRDPLYLPVLGIDKFLLYKRKKVALLTGN